MVNQSCSNADPDVKALNSAIARFARKHEKGIFPAEQKKYEELIPPSAPDATQQYAFEVDLDKCTGCKACVTACHNENGLDPDETWRAVGLLQGGTSEQPALQHITTACHHCAEPACMNGCPTLAYTKDEATGIVKHLDDQCFGCQYCILKCPYDVPKYSKKRGIVHKCDMCIGRLSDQQAPACVRACPTGAIRISLVDRIDVRKNVQNYVNIPDAPQSDYTFPTTKYVSKKPLPANLQAADYYSVAPEHAHWPLVFMLVMTQLSVGGFVVEFLIRHLNSFSMNQIFSQWTVFLSLVVGLLALAASIFHLGRPHLAFRAILGFKTSWLSREIIAFAVFAKLAILYTLCFWNPTLLETVQRLGINVYTGLGIGVMATGLLGVFCSIRVYQDTRRPFWDTPLTALKFFMTAIVLGIACQVGTLTLMMSQVNPLLVGSSNTILLKFLGWGLVVATLFKMGCEALIFLERSGNNWSMLQKSAQLMKQQLKNATYTRYLLGLLGGILIPAVTVLSLEQLNFTAIAALGVLSLCLTFASELCERYLFFTAVVPLKMPGGMTID